MTLDGTWTELMFQLASMITLLVSVSKSIENGYRVVSYEKNSYILNKKSKNISKMKKERGVCVVDVFMRKNPGAGFGGQR